jgi:hypothetical protein
MVGEVNEQLEATRRVACALQDKAEDYLTYDEFQKCLGAVVDKLSMHLEQGLVHASSDLDARLVEIHRKIELHELRTSIG